MAKDTKDKGKAKDKEKTKGKKESPIGRTVTFGVAALAKEMDIEPATARVKLRDAGVKPKGGVYDFGDKAGVAKMAKKLAA